MCIRDRVIVRLVFQDIDINVRLAVLDKRNYNRADRRAEAGLQVFKHTVEPRALIAQAVDKENFCKARCV